MRYLKQTDLTSSLSLQVLMHIILSNDVHMQLFYESAKNMFRVTSEKGLVSQSASQRL